MDPRSIGPQQRVKNHSPLMKALSLRQSITDTINFCPFQCADEDLDEHGFCGHLVGFYNGGQTFEPRARQKDNKGKLTNRIIVDGSQRQPMKKGYKLVKITTSARVYSPNVVKELVPGKNQAAAGVAETMEQERKLLEFAERIRNPVLDGEWEDSVYSPTKDDSEGRETGVPPK